MLKEDLKRITINHLRSTKRISARAANCCVDFGLENLFQIVRYFENNGSFFKSKMRNAGRKTYEELDELCVKAMSSIMVEKPQVFIKKTIEHIRELTEEERDILLSLANLVLDIESVISEKRQLFYSHCSNSFTFAVDFYLKNGHFPMCWMLEQYIVNDKSREIYILINSFKIFHQDFKENKSVYGAKLLEEIAKKCNLTRERVRQIRYKTFHRTFEITEEVYEKDINLLKYKKLLQNKDDWAYVLELSEKTYINQESIEIQEYLRKEQCNLSTEFAVQIIAYLLRDTFSLFGGFEISNRNRFWKSVFLIKKTFASIFDFEKFMKEFTNHVTDNEIEYDLNVDEILSNSSCWIFAIDLNKFDSIVSIIKDILLYEFYLYSNPNGLITIPATKERNLSDVVYGILRQNGNPMHIEEIFLEFKKIFPEHKYFEAAQLRPYLYKNEAISHRNRSSTYTLKEWKYIKSGTIRDAIVEFLSKNDLPQTVDDITEYVLQHFPDTNVASVRTSMFNDTRNRFSFFGDNLFGLVRKEYPSEYEEIEQQKGQKKPIEQRLYDLEKFLSENDHFPFSTSDNENEISLYRWWRVLNKKMNKLTEQQMISVVRIKNQYVDYETDKTVYEWFFHFNDLKLFVLENRRLPSASGSEKFLRGWLCRAKDDFLNDRLSERQRIKYAELFKEIEYVER